MSKTGRVRRARFPTKTSLSPLRTEVGDTGAMKASVGRIVKRKLGFHYMRERRRKGGELEFCWRQCITLKANLARWWWWWWW